MIAIVPFSGKIGRTSYTVMGGKSVPAYVLKEMDVQDALKKGIIKEEKEDEKPVKGETSKNKEDK